MPTHKLVAEHRNYPTKYAPPVEEDVQEFVDSINDLVEMGLIYLNEDGTDIRIYPTT